MKKRILRKGLEVSAMRFGCMGFKHAYGTAITEKYRSRRSNE
ncbi:hypothetical protein [Clostridium butyricum]|nr:hypothetical protein [Clostridium butyricum]MDU0325005.1 hypothetical protein [Clostridium butyricum]